MGVNDLLELAPVKDTNEYESGLGDWWNRNVPFNAMRIGDITVSYGMHYVNTNKNDNYD